MSINTREDANKYYQVINGLVDDYIDKWKIRPSNLKRYLQPGSERFNRFLERNRLNDVKGADRVLKDIIEDRFHMEKDGVMTFEGFNIFESNDFKIDSMKQSLYKGIEKSTTDSEKILADYFDTSLGHIDVVDSGSHVFKLDHWKGGIYAVIYCAADLNIIKENITEFCYDQLKSQKVKITDSISIDLNSLIKEDTFNEKMGLILTDNKVIDIVTECLGIYKFDGEFNDYFIWIKSK